MVEIPGEKMPPQKKHNQKLTKITQAWAQAIQEEDLEKAQEIAEQMKQLSVSPRTQKFRQPMKMETYLKETSVTKREEHVREDEEKLAAWVEKMKPPAELGEEEEENPFESELWKLFPDLPRNSDLFFNKNKRRIIPEGYKVKKNEEEEKATKVLVVDPYFDIVLAEGQEQCEIALQFPFPFSVTEEVWKSYPDLGLFPLSIQESYDKAKYYWRVKIIKE